MLLHNLQERVVEFDYEKGNPKHKYKHGITGLAAKTKKPIRIDDIREEQAKHTVNWTEYIDLGKGTRSELTVPIFDALDPNKVIGVINLESKLPNAFTQVHQRIIEHIARHVAIAIQKNDYIRRIEDERDRINKLQRTLELIARRESKQMLLQASELLSGLSGVFAVVIVLMDRLGRARESDVYTDRNQYLAIKGAFCRNEESYIVYKTNQARIYPRRGIQPITTPEVTHGLCLPLRGKSEGDILGVMWFHFNQQGPDQNRIQADQAVYQLFANQVGLAYENVQQREQAQTQFKNSQAQVFSKIEQDYRNTRGQSFAYFVISLFTSVLGIVLLILIGRVSLEESSVPAAIISVAAGILGQVASLFIFNEARESHKRMDAYHKELFRLKQLDVMLMSAQDMSRDKQEEVRHRILDQAARSAFSGVSSEAASPVLPASKEA